MSFLYYFSNDLWGGMAGLGLFTIWTLIWNGLGLWHSAKHKQKYWFIAILLLNTAGLLPIVYLIWFRPDSKSKINSSSKIIKYPEPIRKPLVRKSAKNLKSKVKTFVDDSNKET